MMNNGGNNRIDRLIAGLQLINQYEQNPVAMSTYGNTISLLNYQRTFRHMTDRERQLMSNWGWSTNGDSWEFRVG